MSNPEKPITNLFSYATKELSQDAFLRWLLENYDCEDANICEASRRLIWELTGVAENERIESVKTCAQWKKIDIKAEIKTDKRTVLLFIEDKVGSEEHDQLKTYNESIEKEYRNEECHKIFYKTEYLSDKEKEKIDDMKWTEVNIKKIADIFKNVKEDAHPILRDYANYVAERQAKCDTKKMPNQPEDYLAWKYYLKNVYEKEIQDKGYEVETQKSHYSYVDMKIRPKGKKSIPYMEIRSRDFKPEELVVRLLTYGVEDKVRKKIPFNEIAEKVQGKLNLFTINPNYKQQLAKATIKASDDEARKAAIAKCLDEYNEILKVWETK